MNIQETVIKKNINIELLRIVSIIMVILIHVYSEVLLDGVYSINKLLYIPAFFKVSVPCFLMITGYLFSTNKDLKKFWYKNIFRLIIPFIILMFLYEFLGNFIGSGVTLINYIENLDLISFIKNIFLIDDVLNSRAYHFWYIIVLVQLYLLYPVFKIVCLKENENIQKFLIIILFILFVLLYTVLSIYNYNIFTTNFISKYSYFILYFLIGYYLKDNLHKIKINKYIFLIIYFVMIFLSIISANVFELNNVKSVLFLTSFSYNFIFIFFASLAFFIFFMKLDLNNNRFILFLGKKTLFVYFVHVIIIYSILQYCIINNCYLDNSFVFCILVSILCYILSIILSIIFDGFYKLIFNFTKLFRRKVG